MMASNPMQRKIRNSVLLGVLGTLIVTGTIIVLLFGMLKQKNDELVAIEQSKKMVYTLTQSVTKGQVLTEDMFQLKSIISDSIPDNATSTLQVIESWFLQTKEGEKVRTDKNGMYLDRSIEGTTSDTIIEVQQYVGGTTEDYDGNKMSDGDYYIDMNGEMEKVKSKEDVITDEYGMFIVNDQGKDLITRVYQEDITGEFYVFKIDTASMNADGQKVRVKEYIDIKNVPVIAKVNMDANTVITEELVVQSTEVVTDDTRQEEYNVVVLPVDLMTNDYIDIRLMTPNGQNFIVVSKAQVEIPMDATGAYFADTIRVNLREDEILAMSSAIVEAAGIPGSKLYAVRYVDPAMQEESFTTYVPNAEVTALLGPDGGYSNYKNPNILETAKQALAERYSSAAIKVRNDYLNSLINGTEEYKENIQSGMEENLGTSITTRQKYLESLGY